ncbi:MAG: MFS transporter [Planctomycetota bacterium]
MLPRRVQVGYAAADVGVNAVETMLRLYLLVLWTERHGLRADLAGLAVALAVVWDAVTDPVMGALSDRLAPRWGRRPWLWSGGVLLGLAVPLLFAVEPPAGQGAMFAWLVFASCVLGTAMTVLNVPHMAMAAELSQDRHERSALFGWRFAAMNVGAVLAAALPAVWIVGDGRTVDALPQVAAVIAGVVVLTALWTWRAVRGAAPPPDPTRVDHAPPWRELFSGWRAAFANPAFGPLLLAYVVATVGIGANATLALYYYRLRLGLPDREVQLLLVVALSVFTASVAFWVALSRRVGKNRPLVVGALLLGVGGSVVYPALPRGDLALALLCSAGLLGSLVGCIALLDSLLTDVVDLERVRTGAWRSGAFFGVWRFASKLARAVAVALAGLALTQMGIAGEGAAGDGQHAALGWLFGPGVGVWFVAAAAVLARYRFDDRKQQQVQRVLRRRAP